MRIFHKGRAARARGRSARGARDRRAGVRPHAVNADQRINRRTAEKLFFRDPKQLLKQAQLSGL